LSALPAAAKKISMPTMAKRLHVMMASEAEEEGK
jgi:hypothetical protein